MSSKPAPNELWGPPISKYIDDFKQRTPAFAMNMQEVYPADRAGFTPLSKLARLFVASEEVHQAHRQPTEQGLITPIAALRKHYESNKRVCSLLLLDVLDLFDHADICTSLWIFLHQAYYPCCRGRIAHDGRERVFKLLTDGSQP